MFVGNQGGELCQICNLICELYGGYPYARINVSLIRFLACLSSKNIQTQPQEVPPASQAGWKAVCMNSPTQTTTGQNTKKHEVAFLFLLVLGKRHWIFGSLSQGYHLIDKINPENRPQAPRLRDSRLRPGLVLICASRLEDASGDTITSGMIF